MTITLRTIATIVFVTAVSIGALAATVYTFRGRLLDTPIVGRRRGPSRVARGDGPAGRVPLDARPDASRH